MANLNAVPDPAMPVTNAAPVNAPVQPVVIPVPGDANMAAEPARVIAQARAVIGALLVVLTSFGIGFSDTLPDQLDNLITALGPFIAAGLVWWNAKRQGEATRNAVYSPDAAAAIAEAPPETVMVTRGDPVRAQLPDAA